MTGRMEKARKTNNRFPSLSHRALGNRCRDSHIPTAPVTVFPVLKTKNERSPWLPAFICSVQAHSSMRKCSCGDIQPCPALFTRWIVCRGLMPAISFGDGNPMKAIRQNGYTDTWQQIGRRISRPSAILSISTHWFVPGTGVCGPRYYDRRTRCCSNHAAKEGDRRAESALAARSYPGQETDVSPD
jgi:hypothetical protein